MATTPASGIGNLGQATPWGAMISEIGKVANTAAGTPNAIPTNSSGASSGSAYSSSPWDVSNWTITTGGSSGSGGGHSGGASAGVTGSSGASANATTPFSVTAPVNGIAAATGIPSQYLMIALVVAVVVLIKKKVK